MSANEPGVQVEFKLMPVLMGAESHAAGREIYADRPHVIIRVAGQDKSEVVKEVTEKVKQRFPQEWAAFEKGMTPPAYGTPIEQWGRITPSLAKHLNTLNVRTVEDIVALPDSGVHAVGPGGFKLRDDARKFLTLSQASADLSRLEDLEKSNKEKDEALQSLQKQYAEMQGQVLALMAEKQGTREAVDPDLVPVKPQRRKAVA